MNSPSQVGSVRFNIPASVVGNLGGSLYGDVNEEEEEEEAGDIEHRKEEYQQEDAAEQMAAVSAAESADV